MPFLVCVIFAYYAAAPALGHASASISNPCTPLRAEKLHLLPRNDAQLRMPSDSCGLRPYQPHIASFFASVCVPKTMPPVVESTQ